MYFDRKGQPISAELFGQLHSDRRYKRVAVSSLHGLYVSTVWLGIDYGIFLNPPLIFETMIFREDERGEPQMSDELWCERYATEEQAREGHELAVIAVELGDVS